MAIDSEGKRRSAAGVPFGLGVTPNALQDAEWRQQVAGGYYFADAPVALANVDVDPFDVFTSTISAGTDLGTLTLSATAADYDWSAIAWTGNSGGEIAGCSNSCTLISDRHAIGAWHCGPTSGATVRFRGVNGTSYSATVDAATQIGSTDIRVVRFTSSVNASVSRMQIATSVDGVLGCGFWAPQHSGDVYLRRIATLDVTHINSWWSNSLTSSGKPCVIPLTSGKLALLGASLSPTEFPLLETNLSAINAVLAGYGEEAETIELPDGPGQLITTAAIPAGTRTRTRTRGR